MDGHSIPNLEIDLDLLVAGPLARTAGDLRVALNTIKGPTRQNSEAWNIKLPKTKYHSLSDLKIAICIDQKMCKLDQEIIEKLTKIANFLEGIGATVSFDSMPAFDLEEVHDLYLKNLRGTTGALMNDIDYSLANKEAINIKPEDKSYFAYVTRSAIQTHRDFFNIEQKRQIIRNEWAKFFENWDILLCPNTASTAMYHDQELPRHQRTILINGKKESYNDQLFWPGLAVYSYLPSTSFPAGLAKNGLPIGIQAIGPYLHDLDTINFAEMMEVTYGGFKKPPNY